MDKEFSADVLLNFLPHSLIPTIYYNYKRPRP